MSDTNVKAGPWSQPQPDRPVTLKDHMRHDDARVDAINAMAVVATQRDHALAALWAHRKQARNRQAALIVFAVVIASVAGWQGWRAGLAAGYNQGYDQGPGVTISDHSSIDGLLGPILTDPATGLQAARFDLEASDRPDGL
jgi:hypothetical protein